MADGGQGQGDGGAAALDCQRCGACCVNSDENRAEGFRDYVQVFPTDVMARKPDLLKRFTVRNRHGQTHLKLAADGRCVALEGRLGKRVGCGIYPVRPEVCRRVQAGSEECLRARLERGVDKVSPDGEPEATG